MLNGSKSKQTKANLISEINEGFPRFWIFLIPLDLSYYKLFPEVSDDASFLKYDNLPKDVTLNYLMDDDKSITQESSLNTLISSDENISNKTDDSSQEEIKKTKSPKNDPINSFKQQKYEKNCSKGILKENLNKNNELLFYEEEKGKEKDNIPFCIDSCKDEINKENDIYLSKIQNYNINIYNPHINCVNICYPPSSYSPFSSTSKNGCDTTTNNAKKLANEEDLLTEKLPLNVICHNSKNINKLINNLSFNNSNNINFIMNNSFNNLGENFSVNYLQNDLANNMAFSNSLDMEEILNNIEINKEKETNESITKKKIKKTKRKKKKKIDDEYTVEMFGRRGWICEGCNNFNYESRKNCNRCKIPKKPLKKSLTLDNKGNKIIDNLVTVNHKDDWNCYNCGNVNYAFRLNCNRCQMKKESSLNCCNKEI